MADKNKIKLQAQARRKLHIRKRVVGTSDKPRMVVVRSLKHMYIQLIDDEASSTIAALSTLSPSIKDKLKDAKSKVDVGFKLGMFLGDLAKEKGIEKVVFDRNGRLYTGRIKAVAEGARKAGLKF